MRSKRHRTRQRKVKRLRIIKIRMRRQKKIRPIKKPDRIKPAKSVIVPSDRIVDLENRAVKAGFYISADCAEAGRSQEHMLQTFRSWYQDHLTEELSFKELLRIALAFSRGYTVSARQLGSFIPLPLQGTASVIITASNEEQTLPGVISELRRLPFTEIIVVLNGCTDGSYEAVENHSTVIKLNYPDRLGHDVGRAVGASIAKGDILLFTDGDLPLPAEDLAPYLMAVDRGEDVALNDLSPYMPPFSGQDEVTRSKTFLNLCLGRSDLQANSMTAVPHALSRRTIDTIGAAALMVPPKAQALALVHQLKVCAPYTVDVIRNNRVRSGNTGVGNKVARLITGDHIEAIGEAMSITGIRLGYQTVSRSELAKMRNAL